MVGEGMAFELHRSEATGAEVDCAENGHSWIPGSRLWGGSAYARRRGSRPIARKTAKSRWGYWGPGIALSPELRYKRGPSLPWAFRTGSSAGGRALRRLS